MRDDTESLVAHSAAPRAILDNRVKQELRRLKFQFELSDCEDRIEHRMAFINSQSVELPMSQEIDFCIGKCAEERIKNIHKLAKRLNAELTEKSFNTSNTV